MKKIISFISVITAVVLVMTASVSASKTNQTNTPVTESVNTQSASLASSARFTNMLNHNYLYNDDFQSDKTIIENSILALLEKVENDEIDKDVVLSFITNMYGLNVDENAAVYDFLPASEGKFAVLARGYDTPSHTVTNVIENDGGYVVNSVMTVSSHDNGNYSVNVKTVFVKNETSAFGYNIVSSDIIDDNSNGINV